MDTVHCSTAASAANDRTSLVIDLEHRILLLNDSIEFLSGGKATKQLSGIVEELSHCNIMIQSDTISVTDKFAVLMNIFRLQKRRKKLWEQLVTLPVLEEERYELMEQLKALQKSKV